MCGIFNLLSYNYLYEGANDLRYFLPAYPIYLIIIYLTLNGIAEMIDKKKCDRFIAVAIIILAISNLMNANQFIYSSTPIYPNPDLGIEPNSTVYIDINEDADLYYYYFSEIDNRILKEQGIDFMKVSHYMNNTSYILSSKKDNIRGYHIADEYDNIATLSKIYLYVKRED
jgi:hypothetical protein